MYILYTHDKRKFIINETEKEAAFKAVMNSEKALFLHGEMIPLQIAPTIMKFERWYTQENERLAMTDRRLCKKCLSIMSIFDSCACWENTGKGEEKNAIAGVLSESLNKLAESKKFPALTEEDKEDIEAEKKALNEAPEYVEIGGQLGYKDEESGEIMYS